MLPGETIHSGASNTCGECGKLYVEKVLQSAAGYFIGTSCCFGVYSRESHYYKSREEAQKALDTKTVNYRT